MVPTGRGFPKTHVVVFCVSLFCSMSSEALKENQGDVWINSSSEAACDIFTLEQPTGRPSILRQSQADNISKAVHRGAKVGFSRGFHAIFSTTFSSNELFSILIIKNVIYSFGKDDFSAVITHDPSEIIVTCLFGAQEMLINLKNQCAD